MIMTQEGLKILTLLEGGMKLTAYDDGTGAAVEFEDQLMVGYATIGVGHLIMDHEKHLLLREITEAEGLALLAEDVKDAEDCVNRYVSGPHSELNLNEFDALTSFCFNVGRTAFRQSTLVRLLNGGASREEIPKQMARWTYSKGEELEGLQRRREVEGALFSAYPHPPEGPPETSQDYGDMTPCCHPGGGHLGADDLWLRGRSHGQRPQGKHRDHRPWHCWYRWHCPCCAQQQVREGEFWQEWKENFPAGPDWQRIESGETASGIPDLNGCHAGVEIWVELKSMERGLKIPGYTSFQCGWLLRRSRVGGRSYLAVRIQKRTWGDGIIIWPGSAAREVMDQGLRAEALSVICMKNGVSWADVSECLFGPDRDFRKRAW